jgi:hypothetical protein
MQEMIGCKFTHCLFEPESHRKLDSPEGAGANILITITLCFLGGVASDIDPTANPGLFIQAQSPIVNG